MLPLTCDICVMSVCPNRPASVIELQLILCSGHGVFRRTWHCSSRFSGKKRPR